MTDDQRSSLIQAAIQAQQRAYAPYSNFAVGAAILTAGGNVYPGANVENASYGLTICAERVAAATAVAAGDRDFVAIAIASRGGASPCGACRQFLAEFSPSMRVVTVDSENREYGYQSTLDDLLPNRFDKGRPLRKQPPTAS
jgi:cytidine deaminase